MHQVSLKWFQKPIINRLFVDPQPDAMYDFIVVGAGAAGCTLANRLSENRNWRVLLLEAGGTENFFHQIPVMAAFLQGTHSNWNYKSEPQKLACFGMNDNMCALPRGRVLGGTSSINYMIYNRGNKRDFDRWAEYGNKGWSYKEVLPYFLKSENANLKGLRDSKYHNVSGPLNVEHVDYKTKIVKSWVQAANEAGHKSTDYNGESQVGVSFVQATTKGGHRFSAAKAFIEPAQNRPNLQIITFARVTKILINNTTKEAYGVQYMYNDVLYTANAKREVILSSGAFNSPQLLMLSGIGPSDNLNAIGIPIVKELPVGEILYDHMCHFGPTIVLNSTGNTLNIRSIKVTDMTKYLFHQPSILSIIGGVEALAFAKVPQSSEPADFPDVELIFVSGSFASDLGTGLKQGANLRNDIYDKVYKPLESAKTDHFSNLVMHFHPKSKGRIWLHNRDPFADVKIDPKYYSNSEDVEFLLGGIKESIKIMNQPTMKRLGARLHDIHLPGCNKYSFGSDDYWRCSIRTLSYTLHHQVATCRMGPASNPTTVVDERLRVHGIKRLRVADTSIIPFPPTAHTNAAAFMIGEKAADMIKEDNKS